MFLDLSHKGNKEIGQAFILSGMNKTWTEISYGKFLRLRHLLSDIRMEIELDVLPEGWTTFLRARSVLLQTAYQTVRGHFKWVTVLVKKSY